MLDLVLMSNQRGEVSSLPTLPCPQAVSRVSLLPSEGIEQADAWGRFAGTGADTTSQLDDHEWRLFALRARRGIGRLGKLTDTSEQAGRMLGV